MRTCDIIALVLFVVAAIAGLIQGPESRFALPLVGAGLAFTVAPAAFQWT